MKKLIFISLLLAIPFTCNAETKESKKEQFITLVTNAITTKLCLPEQLFMSCFNISESDCQSAMKSSAKQCREKMDKELPGDIDSREKASNYSAAYTTCIASSSGLVFVDKIKDTKVCKSILSTNSGVKTSSK